MAERNDSLRETIHKRGEILRAIADQPRSKPALTDALEASRSTVDRGVAELEQEGCIERRSSDYHSTILGKLAWENYQKYCSDIEALNRASELLINLPESANISTTFIRDADIHISNPRAPEAALRPTIDLLENANRMLGLTPVGLSLYIELIHEYANTNDLSVEIIVEEGTLQPIIDLDEKRLSELASEGHLDILVVDEPLHYALWLMESSEGTTAGATFYEKGGVDGIIANSSPEAVSWARDEYERYHSLAEHVAIDDIFDK